MYLTQQFARFIAGTDFEDLPKDVVDMAKERVMDSMGAVIAGSCNWEYAEKLCAACRLLGTGSFAPVGGKEKCFPSARAAMIDATYAHAIELDDGHRNCGCHAGSVVVPTALVLGQELGKTGEEIITAVALGYEIVYRIGSHANPGLINKGFHPSSCCDVFGAAVAAGKLLGLNEEQLANAIGQAGMLASGTMEATKSGQLSKCVQVGNAAYSGIMAAYLAQTGMEGCISALEGPDGFFRTHSENVDIDDVCRDLGEKWSIFDTYNKMYPSCRHAQPGIEAALDLSEEYSIRPEDVESVHIGTHRVAYELTGHIKAPKSSGEAKFSLAYGVAAALRDHAFGVAHLTKPYYTDPETLALAAKVETELDPDVQAVFPGKRGAKVSIALRNGTTYEKELYDLKGSPNNPVGWKELAAKFKANALALYSEKTVDALLDSFSKLDTFESIDPVMGLLEQISS